MHAKTKMFSRKRLSVFPERPRRISESVNALSDTKNLHSFCSQRGVQVASSNFNLDIQNFHIE